MLIYESTVIFSPELPTEKLDEFLVKIKNLVEQSKGSVLLSQQLGKKKLAYPIKKFRDGSYLYLELTGPGTMVAELENFYKVNDTIIRFLTLKIEKKPVVAKPVEAAQPSTEAQPAEPVVEQPKAEDASAS